MKTEPANGERSAEDTQDTGDTGDGLPIGERRPPPGQDAYADFRRELVALPGAEAFQALVTRYGQAHGYRTVGRWIAGRVPKPKTTQGE